MSHSLLELSLAVGPMAQGSLQLPGPQLRYWATDSLLQLMLLFTLTDRRPLMGTPRGMPHYLITLLPTMFLFMTEVSFSSSINFNLS